MSRPPKSKPQISSPETSDAPARRATKRGKSGASLRRRLAAEKSTALATKDRASSLELSLQAQAARIATLEASLAVAIRDNADLARRLGQAYAENCNAEQEVELLRAVVVETAISNHANGSSLRSAAKSRNIANSLERADTLRSGDVMAMTDGVLR